MVKFVEVKDGIPKEKTSASTIVEDFIESELRTAKLDTSDDPRLVGPIHSSLYNYLRQHPKIDVGIRMVNGEIYLFRLTAKEPETGFMQVGPKQD